MGVAVCLRGAVTRDGAEAVERADGSEVERAAYTL